MKTDREKKIIYLKKKIKELEKKYNQIKYETEFIRSDNTFDKMLKEYLKKNKKKTANKITIKKKNKPTEKITIIKDNIPTEKITITKEEKPTDKITITKDNILYDFNMNVNYIQNSDYNIKKSNINSLTNSNISEKELIQARINDKTNYNKITNNIINSCQKCINSKLTKNEFTKLITILGTDIKNTIIHETKHNSGKFIPIKEAEQSKTLRNKNNNDIFSISMIQLISTGKEFKKVITLSFDYDKKTNSKILKNENEQLNFIEKKKKEYSIALKINEDKILLTNIHYDPFSVDLIINEEREIDLYKCLKKDKEIFDITFKPLLKECFLKEEIFDKKGNRYGYEYGKNKKRGPPNYLKDYFPPYGYTGFGLNVFGKYDNGDDTWLGCNNKEGEWYIAYHGTGYNTVPSKIIEEGFKFGDRQEFDNCDNINPLSNKLFPKCGKGIYITPDIDEAETYSSLREGVKINGQYYYFIFMCRVNPYRVRFIMKDGAEYWVVGGDSINKIKGNKNSDEIRPYRILIKKMYESYNSPY